MNKIYLKLPVDMVCKILSYMDPLVRFGTKGEIINLLPDIKCHFDEDFDDEIPELEVNIQPPNQMTPGELEWQFKSNFYQECPSCFNHHLINGLKQYFN